MANRAYLYSANKELSRLRDLSESRHPIPLVYKIVLGIDTRICDSKIWNYEHPIAIQGNFEKGLNRLYDFFEYLETQSSLDQKEVSRFKQETKAFFEEHKERISDLFFMEAGEIYDLIGDIDPLEQQNESLYNEIVSISGDLSEILEAKPSNLFDFKNSYWISEIKEDLEVLAPYWTHVTYFSFNKSDN